MQTISERIFEFMKTGPKHLSEIYAAIPDKTQKSICGRIAENIGRKFVKLKMGVYRNMEENEIVHIKEKKIRKYKEQVTKAALLDEIKQVDQKVEEKEEFNHAEILETLKLMQALIGKVVDKMVG